MNGLYQWMHYGAVVLYYLNPIFMLIACCLWMRLYNRTSKCQHKIEMRYFVLERQLDVILRNCSTHQMDMDMIKRLKEMGDEI